MNSVEKDGKGKLDFYLFLFWKDSIFDCIKLVIYIYCYLECFCKWFVSLKMVFVFCRIYYIFCN